MSNTMVGTVYQKIMEDVIENCVVTFEEDGVERKLLDEVKKTWQTKLSERKVATMPWDPAPAPPSIPPPASAAPAQTAAQAPPASQAKTVQPKQEPASVAPTVKAEPGASNYDLQNLPQANGATAAYNTSAGAALDRTTQQLHDKFGAAAGPQISQLQARRAMMSQNAPQQAGSQADMEAKKRQYDMAQAQNAQRMKAQLAAQQQRPVGNGQTDGTSEWQSFVTERRAAAAADRGLADYTLRQQLESSSLAMEGGGLPQPVSRQRTSIPIVRTKPSFSMAGGQYDGGDDDDDIKDDDDDAINSDLDDPEDELDREETDEDANQGEIMLCTYDKVQRVKNKWKCTLKDGVLTTGGKEYVFHKAQGDFEW